MGKELRTSFESFVPDGSLEDLELVLDEIFVDMGGGEGSECFARTCYDQAVEDCLRVQENCFVLKVRPDTRGLLIAQIRKHSIASPVYRSSAMLETRLIPTGDLEVRFARRATASEKLVSIGGCIVRDRRNSGELTDGTYRLTGKFASEPVVTAKVLEFRPAIQRAVPLMVRLPSPTQVAESKD